MIIAKGELGTLYALEIDARAWKNVLARLQKRGAYTVAAGSYRYKRGFAFFRQTICCPAAWQRNRDDSPL